MKCHRLWLISLTLGGGVFVAVVSRAQAPVIRPLAGHTEAVTSVDFSADGKFLASASFDKTIRLWDLVGLKEAKSLTGHTDQVYALAYLRSGPQLLSGGQDRSLRLWNLPGGDGAAAVAKLAHSATALVVSPNGNRLVVGHDDGSMRVVDAQSLAVVREWKGHAGAIQSLTFSGSKLVSAAADQTVRSWDIDSGREEASLNVGQPVLLAAAVNGSAVYTASAEGVVRKWAWPPRPAAHLSLDAMPLAAFASDGRARSILLASSRGDALLVGSAGNFRWADLRRGGVIDAIALHPSHPDLAAIVGGDATLRLLRLSDGAVSAILGHLGAVGTAVAFSLDDKKLALGLADGTLRVLTEPLAPPAKPMGNKPPPAPGQVVGKQGAAIRAVAFISDAKVVSAGDDGAARVWDLATSKPMTSVTHGGPVRHAVVTPDGKSLLTGGSDGKVKVWSLADGKALGTIDVAGEVVSLAVSPNGSMVAAVSRTGTLRLATLTGVELRTLPLPDGLGVVFLDDRTVLAASRTRAEIQSVGVAWAEPVGKPAVALAASADGNRIYVCQTDGAVRWLVAATGKVERTVTVPTPVAMALSPDGRQLALASGDKVVRLVDTANGNIMKSYPASREPLKGVAFSRDGRHLLALMTHGVATVWTIPADKDQGTLVREAAVGAPAVAAIFLADGQTLAAAAGRELKLLRAPPPPVVALGNHNAQVYCVAASADGKLAASGSADNKILVWDVAARKTLKALDGHKGQVYGVAFRPDGKFLVSGGGDKAVILWDLAQGKSIRTFAGAEDAVYQVAFTPDGKQVLAAGLDRKIRFWEVESGKLLRTLEEQKDDLYGLALNRAGDRLASCGRGGSVVVWDLATGKPVFRHQLSFGAYAVAFHPSGERLAVAHDDKNVYLIDLPGAKGAK